MEIEVINFTRLDEARAREALAWRNHPFVRARSNSGGEIPWETHQSFINALKTDKTRAYYYVSLKDGQGGGVIHFSGISETTAAVGLYKRPDSQTHKTGDTLMSLIELLARNMPLQTITLDVLKTNARAIALYRRRGFQTTSETELSLFMEKSLD